MVSALFIVEVHEAVPWQVASFFFFVEIKLLLLLLLSTFFESSAK